MTNAFIYETENNRVQRLIAVSLVAIIFAAGIALFLIHLHVSTDTAATQWYSTVLSSFTRALSPIQLFIVSILGATIFFPLPLEIFFIFTLKQGHSAIACIGAVVIGWLIGHMVNYFLGSRFSKYIRYLLSAKKFFSIRRKINRWGPYAIVSTNLLPAASDILAFGLGTIRYNKKRMFALIAITTLIKYSVLALAATTVLGLL